jgi:hypothetical protein
MRHTLSAGIKGMYLYSWSDAGIGILSAESLIGSHLALKLPGF